MNKESNRYDYRRVTVKGSMISWYVTAYKYWGWDLVCPDHNDPVLSSHESMELEFRRDKRIRNKAELTRLQRNFDACVDEICEMEDEKSKTADKAAHGVSLIGSVCLCCSVLLTMACELSVGILLAIPGIFGWLLPGFLHKKIVKEKTEEVEPQIEQKYKEIRKVCQSANGLTDCE